MNGDPALIAILADLWKIRHWCNKHPSQELPPSAVTYLCVSLTLQHRFSSTLRLVWDEKGLAASVGRIGSMNARHRGSPSGGIERM
jgi:hypothetical protein